MQSYDAFGPQRMFWGTDITKMPCSWRQRDETVRTLTTRARLWA